MLFLPSPQAPRTHPLVVVDEDEDGPELPVQTQTSPDGSKAETCGPVAGRAEETGIEMQVRNSLGAVTCDNAIKKKKAHFSVVSFFYLHPDVSLRRTDWKNVSQGQKPKPLLCDCRPKRTLNLPKAVFLIPAAVVQ